MNAQFQIAQVIGAPNSSNATPVRIFRLSKPLSDQAVVVNLGYDQKVKLDFSSIANEKITLVHVGEKLIILFDNKSTVTVDPFFDSRHDASNLSVEVAPGRDVSVSEFASLFPITTDQSVLPAAGDGNGNAQASGANFSNSSVDPLDSGNPLELLGQEQLGSFALTPDTFAGLPTETTATPGPTIVAGLGLPLAVDESFIPAIGSQQAPAGSNIATVTFAASFTSDAPAGVQSITYALTINNAITNLIDSVSGQVVTLVQNGAGGVDGVVTVNNVQTTVFTLTVNAAGEVTFTELRGVHEATPGDFNEAISLSSGLVSLTATVTDNNSATASASLDLGPQITIHDDGPSIAAVQNGLPALSVDESFLADGSTPDATQTHVTGNFSGAFTHVDGADGATIEYAVAASGATDTTGVDSGLIDSGSGNHVFLFLQNGQIVGREGTIATSAAGGAEVFTISVDAGTGEVTLTQLRAVHEGLGENGDISEGISLDSVVNLVTLTATVTDADGDSDSATIDLGSHLAFDDDGPSITVSKAEGFGVTHDETLLLQSPPFGDDNDVLFTPVFNGVANPGHDPQGIFGLPLGYAQSSGTALAISNLNYGADGPAASGAQVFSLTLTDAQGQPANGPVGSGLKTTDGHAISLFVENGLIVGRYDGSDANSDVTNTGNDPAAFAIAIDPISGKVSVVQYVSLHHDSPDQNGDIDEAVSLANALGQIQAMVTITDGDGDSVSASANIAADIQFEDDGPSVAAIVTRSFGVTADETPGNQANDAMGPLALFANIQNAGDDLDEPGPVLAYASSSAAALTVLPYFGVDGPDPTAPVAYSLKVNSSESGLTLTDGTAITLSLDSSGRVIGTVGTDNVHSDLTGKIAFAIAIDPISGKVSVVEYLSLHHSDSSNPNDTVSLAAGSVSAVVTIKDADGDTASSSADISGKIHFNDDGPKLISEKSVSANVDEDGLHLPGLSDANPDNLRPGEVTGTNSAVAAGAAGTLNALVDFGADGFGSFGLKTVTNPVDTGLSSKGGHILIVTDANGLHGYVDNATPGLDGGDREVFTLTVASDGSYVFTLKDQIDHPTLNDQQGDNAENTLAIDLSSYVVATDGDGDSIPLGTGTFTVTVLDDIPVVTARPPEQTTVTTIETVSYTLQAGNTDIRGMDGQNNHDIKLSGVDLNEGDNSVNTTGGKIGIGDGQIIDGLDTHPGLTGPEILTMSFVNNLQITSNNPNPPIITDSGSYDVSSVTFQIDVAEAHGVESAVVFVSAIDNGNFVALSFAVNGSPVSATAVFQGGVQVGYVLDGVPDLSTVTATGATPFDAFNVGNYNNYQFDSTAGGAHQTFADGNSFKVFGIESTITTITTVTETFKVSEDESPGVNSAADPNAANDVDPLLDIPPAAIAEANAIGYAKSPTSVLASGSLFAGSVGADEPGSYSFAITDKNGSAINSVDSGLKTLDGSQIMLSTDAGGAVVGSVGQTEIFKLYVDGDGFVWIAQYQPIAHDLDGSSQAAFDDIATVTADLHVKATLTDLDGDSTSAVSGVALQVQFQDDGPLAVNDIDSANGALLTATGNVITGTDIAVGFDANTTDGNADTKGTDGAKITDVAGVTTDTISDGSHNFQVAGQFGTLVINENGNYTYTRFDGAPVVGNDVFTYTLTDGDGDFSTAKLTISISDHGVSVSGIGTQGGDETVFENDLSATRGALESDGSSPNASNLTQTGTFHISALDGVDDLSIGGTLVVQNGAIQNINTPITTAYGVLTITGVDLGTGSISYSYQLVDNTLAHGPGDNGPNSVFDAIAVHLTDTDGDAANSSLIVRVVDDVPTASPLAPAQNVAEGATKTGQLDFLQGADGASVTHVNGVALSFGLDGYSQVFSSTHGDFQVNVDGGYRFVAQHDDVYVTGGAVNLNYTVTDADGDTSTSTVAFVVTDDSDPVTATLSATPATSEDGGAITYTVTLTSGLSPFTPTSNLVFTLANGEQVTVAAGATSGSVTIPVSEDDVYLDTHTVSNSIVSHTGGSEYESLVTDPATVTTTITDDSDPVTATLTSSTTSISESGGSITYTVTLTSGLSPLTPTSNLVLTLANGEHVTIAAGASSGSVTTSYTDAQITSQVSITDSITGVFGGGTEYEQLLTVGTTTVPVVYAPTVTVGPNNCLPEDALEAIEFTATPGSTNSHVTQITVSGLTGWTVDAAPGDITLTGGGGAASVTSSSFDAGTGLLTINIAGAADNSAVTAAVLMTPPLNSDLDRIVTMAATAVQGPTTVTSASTAGTIFVDAVADAPTPVNGQTHIVFVTDSNDAGSAFTNGETGKLEVKAIFGDVHDGSESRTLDIHLQSGFTASLAASGTMSGTYNGTGATFSYTYNSATGDVHIVVPNDAGLSQQGNQTATIDLSFGVTAPASGTLPDNLNFSITATATESQLSGGGCGPGNTDVTADNVATVTDSTAIPAAHLLSGKIVTNSNSSAQDMILTFVDQEHPLDAFSQLVVTNAQGQQGNVTSDAGFNINNGDHFLASLDSPFDTSKIIVTSFALNGTTMKESNGNIQLETNSGGPTHDGFTAIMQTNHAAVIGSDSNDSHTANATLSDPSANNGTYNMVYVDGSGGTATGSSDADLLSAAGTNNHVIGGAGNDVLVYHQSDIQIDGGAGFDILRIDQGAIYNSHIEIPSASNNGVASNVVDLTSNAAITNVESILLTEEPIADSSFGTELHLSYKNVINFTGETNNELTGTAHTLFVLGSPGDDVVLPAGFTETANTYTSAGGQVFHQWTASGASGLATIFIDNDLQVNHAAQA